MTKVCAAIAILAKSHFGYVPQRGETIHVPRVAIVQAKSKQLVNQAIACAERRGVIVVVTD